MNLELEFKMNTDIYFPWLYLKIEEKKIVLNNFPLQIQIITKKINKMINKINKYTLSISYF